MILGGKPRAQTVIDPRSANEISEAKKNPSPEQIAKRAEARRTKRQASIRDRLLNPPMEHVDTVSVLHYSSSSDTKPTAR
jgi:hypothetical protein